MLDSHLRAEPKSIYVSLIHAPSRRLDGFLPGLMSTGDRLAIKLDVQGYELPVLFGAAETIRSVSLLECELSLAPLYEGQTLYRDMIEYLYSLGFELVGMEPGFVDGSSGSMLQLDGTFARTGS
jgi:hypothetical protein